MHPGRTPSEGSVTPPDNVPPTPLPRPRDALVGRAELELTTLEALAPPGALVTLLGPGGVGKTRLALACAAALEVHLEVVFCDLSAARSRVEAVGITARSLGVPCADGAQSTEAAFAARLGLGADTLLVLDNFESVLDAAGDVRRWMDRAPELRVLATSCTPLDVGGEHCVIVAPLGTDAVDGAPSAAATLFLTRAAERGGAVTDAHERGAVEALVRALDGLPLAIELAAARAATLSPSAMLPLLRDRFGLLVGSRRDAPARHRSLRATLDAAWERLDPDARALLTASALLGTCVDVDALTPLLPPHLQAPIARINALQSLHDSSLARAVRCPEVPRVELLDTVRLYVLDRLDADTRRDLLARWVALLLEGRDALAPAILACHLPPLVDQLVRTADRVHDVAVIEVALALDRRARHALHPSARLALWDALAARSESHPLPVETAARMHLARGADLRWAGDFQRARDEIRRGEAALPDDAPLALQGALAAERARLAFNGWHLDDAREAALRAVTLARAAGDPAALATALDLRAWAHFLAAEHADALACYDEAARLWTAHLPQDLPPALVANRALCLLDCGDVDGAEAAIDDALARARARGDRLTEATAQAFLGAIRRRRGDTAGALRCFDDAADRCARLGHLVWQCVLTMEAGLTLLNEGRWAEATARLEGARLQIDEVPGHACAAMVRVCLALAFAGDGDLAGARGSLADASRLARGDGPMRVLVDMLATLLAAHTPDEVPPLPDPDAPLWRRLGDHVVLVRRVLERVRQSCFPPADAIVLRGDEVRLPGGQTLDAVRHRTSHRLLLALARAPGAALKVDALFAAGWPGQNACADARTNRVRVALTALRKLGVGDALRFDGVGYRLEGVPVVTLGAARNRV